LLRAGRFDRHVYLELPNRHEREAIFLVHLKPLKLSNEVDHKLLAAQTPGFSGADIAQVCNEAALIAARHKKQAVEQADFMDAIDREIAGLEKKTRVITPAEKKIIAFHEAGHAVVSWMLPSIDPLLKVSIIPRGKSLGGAWFLPEEKLIIPKRKFLDQLCATLAGRASEEITFGDISSGALDDLEKATKQAYNMVSMLGLSDKVGNLSFFDSTGTTENGFLKPYSEAMAKLIDEEVQQLLGDAYARAKDILIANRKKLENLAQDLLAREILTKPEIENILGRRQVSGIMEVEPAPAF
jgi:cell division protease FtsH